MADANNEPTAAQFALFPLLVWGGGERQGTEEIQNTLPGLCRIKAGVVPLLSEEL